MSWAARLLLAAVIAAEAGIVAALGYAVWTSLTIPEQAALAEHASSHVGPLIILALTILAAPTIIVVIFARWYGAPLRTIAEAMRVIAVSNPRHRLPVQGTAEVRRLAESGNLLADRFQALGEEVEARIRETNGALEEERNTLAALMSKLTQGVVVCNPDGRILLYNNLAQSLLGSDRDSDWIGLGRPIGGLLGIDVLQHALSHVHHRLAEGETALLVPFVASRPGGQMLSVHLVPILSNDRSLRGYILTIDDITHRSGTEKRRGTLLQSLLQGQRSSIAGIRAAIEIVLGNPELSSQTRQQFLDVISEEASRMSQHLDTLEHEYAPELKANWPLEDMLGSDLLAAIQRRVRDVSGMTIEVSVPLEPVRLRVDSFAIAQIVVFFVERIGPICRATDFQVHLEVKRRLAAIVLEWTGAALDMEALKSWWDRTIIPAGQGQSLTLFDVIERHEGATWARDAEQGRRPAVHVVLPVSDTSRDRAKTLDDEPAGPDFDFRLFAEGGSRADLDEITLDKLHFTVIDTETTGLDPAAGDEIIAIGAVRIVNGRILRRETFDCFVNPQRNVPLASQAIHGISPAMLRTMPTIDEVLPRLRRFVETSVIVGHNVGFDMRFFAMKEAATGIRFPNPVLDTLLLEHVVHPNTEDKSLEAIAERLGVVVTGRHTALGDALATAEIFVALLPILAERGISTLRDARRACESHALAKMTH